MMDRNRFPARHVGFVSTRFSGTDGVSLESRKWAQVLEENGFCCFWFAGEVDRQPNRSLVCPEAHFQHETNCWINERVFGKKQRTPQVTRVIHELRSRLKARLHRFIQRHRIDLIVAENVLTIPMHVPLGLALTEAVAETQIPTISHNHDFFWERVRYSINAVGDYLRMAFPPTLPNIQHAVINSEAQEQLALRTGIASVIVPNVLDFDRPPAENPEGARRFRAAIGLKQDDRMILQPTRVVQRKGIDHAIELVRAIGDPRNKLVVSHEAGDEGFAYAEWLQEHARDHAVDLRFVRQPIADPWTDDRGPECPCTLWDVYPHADFITYPSLYEGFGNAFLEGVYFRKPMLINRYATFVRDIEPLGFDLIVMDGFLSRATAGQVKAVLEDPRRRQAMVARNYAVAARHYSYGVLLDRLEAMLRHFFGGSVRLCVPRRMDIAASLQLDAAARHG